jgi:isovaleryl-CoA dehydrogenase
MIPMLDEIGEFARSEVLATLEQRYSAGEFWRETWRSMGELGLFGICLPADLGGRGGTFRDLAASVRRFAHDSCDMGLTLSWITHLALCVTSIERFGTAEQKGLYLPKLISGEWVGAAAVSEPGTGAHPGGIETTATPTGDGYRLHGKKLYITDGTVADLLVVVAATGESAGLKELTAFLVETATEGVTSSRMELEFLKTSPHAQMTFEDVMLPGDAVLGKPGEGHSRASRSAFARERSLVLSAFAGLFKAASTACAQELYARTGRFELEGKASASWIHHLAALEAYSTLSSDLVEAAFSDSERWKKSMDTLIYLGISYAKWAGWIVEFAAGNKLGSTFPLDTILNDVKLVLVGEGIIYKEGRRRFIDSFN